MTPFQDLLEIIRDEEKAAVSRVIAERIAVIENMPDGRLRARIFAAATLIGGAELWSALEDGETVARQLRGLADRLDATDQPRQ